MKHVYGKVRRIVPYFLIPMISAVTPLMVIPVASAKYGAEGWTTIALAQSVGATAALLAELGWGVSGPQRIPLLNQVKRNELYRSSVGTRITAVAVLVPPVLLIAWLLCSADRVGGSLIALGSLSLALSPAWFFIGAGSPGKLLVMEGVPRLLLVGTSAAFIFLGFGLGWYGISLMVSVALTLVFCVYLGRMGFATWTSNLEHIRSQYKIVVGRLISGSYTSFAPALLGVAAPAAVPVFSAVDRLMRMSLNILSGIPSRLQSWLGAAQGGDLRDRSSVSIKLNAALGVLTGVGFAGISPTFAKLIFSGSVDFGYNLSCLSGVLLFLICTSRGLGLSMVALGRANHITVSVVLSSVTGVPLLVGLGILLGPAGALAGQIVAELVGIGVQWVVLVRKRNLDMLWNQFAVG